MKRIKLTIEQLIQGAKEVQLEMGYEVLVTKSNERGYDFEVIAEEIDTPTREAISCSQQGGQISWYVGGTEDKKPYRTFEEYKKQLRDGINWEFNNLRTLSN